MLELYIKLDPAPSPSFDQSIDMRQLVVLLLTLLVLGIYAVPHQQLEDRSPGNISSFALISAICLAANVAIAVGLIKLEKADAFCTSLLNVKTETVQVTKSETISTTQTTTTTTTKIQKSAPRGAC
jgi:hypothetical protein